MDKLRSYENVLKHSSNYIAHKVPSPILECVVEQAEDELKDVINFCDGFKMPEMPSRNELTVLKVRIERVHEHVILSLENMLEFTSHMKDPIPNTFFKMENLQNLHDEALKKIENWNDYLNTYVLGKELSEFQKSSGLTPKELIDKLSILIVSEKLMKNKSEDIATSANQSDIEYDFASEKS